MVNLRVKYGEIRRDKMWDYEMKKLSDRICMFIAWHLPSNLIKWSAIRLMAFATIGKYSDTIVPELTAMEALKRWED